MEYFGKRVMFYCEDCEDYFESLLQLDLMEFINGEHDCLCCPTCGCEVKLTVDK